MKKRIFTIAILIGIIAALVSSNGGFRSIFQPESVKAFGDLTVNFHVPANTPLFNLSNIIPGATLTKPVDVTNGATIAHMVAIKGMKSGGIGIPHLENILTIVIKDGTTPVYGIGSPTGTKTLQDFFTESNSINGIILGSINPSGHKIYNLTITLPLSAGNEYQGKSVIFDITFGTSDIKSIVINEVFYRTDKNHGHNSEKDRDRERQGHDKDDDYDRSDRSSENDEWVELYNPTNKDISLKNWTLTDNSGNATIIHEKVIIKAKGFVIVTKDDDIWHFWKKPHTTIVELGHSIGDGLDDTGDHLILKNNEGQEMDRMSWGTDTSGFTPNAINPVVPKGSSTSRIAAGFDTGKASDWHQQTPPTPGF